MSEHINQAFVESMLGATTVDGLTDSTDANLTLYIQLASAKIDAGLLNAGYSSPSSASDFIKLATFGALLPMLYGRKGLTPPAAFLTEVQIANGIIAGTYPVPGMTPTASIAVGGVQFTDSSTTSTDGYPPIFRGLRKVY